MISHCPGCLFLPFPEEKHAVLVVKVLSPLPEMETKNFSKRKGQLKNEQITAVPDKVRTEIMKVLGVST